MSRILNFGSCNIDTVYRLSRIVKEGETVSVQSITHYPGGKGLNQSVALSHAGANVFHAGCIGSDGEFLSDFLKDNGVKTEYLQTVNEKTGTALVQVDDNGENAIMVYDGANSCITHEFADSVLADFSENDYILLQNEINELDYIIETAYKRKIKIVLNPSPINKNISKIDLDKVAILILNKTEALDISKKSTWQDALEYLKNSYKNTDIVLTLGADGSVFCHNDTTVFQEIFKVNAIDTTGAGDTFTGFFLAQIAQNVPIKDALKTASAAAALAVQKKGAASSIPDLSDVQKFM